MNTYNKECVRCVQKPTFETTWCVGCPENHPQTQILPPDKLIQVQLPAEIPAPLSEVLAPTAPVDQLHDLSPVQQVSDIGVRVAALFTLHMRG